MKEHAKRSRFIPRSLSLCSKPHTLQYLSSHRYKDEGLGKVLKNYHGLPLSFSYCSPMMQKGLLSYHALLRGLKT